MTTEVGACSVHPGQGLDAGPRRQTEDLFSRTVETHPRPASIACPAGWRQLVDPPATSTTHRSSSLISKPETASRRALAEALR
jgi:hypothetical protein